MTTYMTTKKFMSELLHSEALASSNAFRNLCKKSTQLGFSRNLLNECFMEIYEEAQFKGTAATNLCMYFVIPAAYPLFDAPRPVSNEILLSLYPLALSEYTPEPDKETYYKPAFVVFTPPERLTGKERITFTPMVTPMLRGMKRYFKMKNPNGQTVDCYIDGSSSNLKLVQP